MRIYLDVSRLLAAGRRSTPSGIERVELAYAKQFGSAGGTRFVGAFLGALHFLPQRSAQAYVESLEYGWANAAGSSRIKTITRMALIYLALLAASLRARLGLSRPKDDNGIYVNVSHENLVSPQVIEKFKSQSAAKMLCLVHDLIPVSHPEYARPQQARLHRQRMATAAALADVVLVNSAATRDEFVRFLGNRDRLPEIHVLHLGIGRSLASSTTADAGPEHPYFIVLATIEPRKNHLLLLNLWRSLAAHPGTAPRLIVVGRRGWENEMVVDMLERCEAIAGLVEERPNVSDAELIRLIQGARALLLPSFAEGYGLPVAEALSLGTPVICSDLPALREIGLGVPEYLDPLDGPAWRQAVLDYLPAASARRNRQCERLRHWSPPSWERHFQQLAVILEALAKPPLMAE